MRGRFANGNVSKGCLLYCVVALLAIIGIGLLMAWAGRAFNARSRPAEAPAAEAARVVETPRVTEKPRVAERTNPIQGPTQRLAILPAFVDEDCTSEWRSALNSFDARVQAELLANWNVEVLSRAGLSAVAFESKLRAATDAQEPALRVLPADAVMISVFDTTRHELRVHITLIRESTELGQPLIIAVNSAADLRDRVPAEAARQIAHAAQLGGKDRTVGLSPPPPLPGGATLALALFDPVSVDGRQSKATVEQAPLLRAVLEQTLATGAVGEVRLLERDETARLLEEQTLKALATPGAEANAASRIGRIRKADLILLPVAQARADRESESILFAIEATTGRMLDCVSWRGATGAPPPLPPIRDFLVRAARGAGLARSTGKPDGVHERYIEAELLVSLLEKWNGLRMSVATRSQIAIRLADAALGLVADDPERTQRMIEALIEEALPAPIHPLAGKFLSHDFHENEIEALRKSGQLAALRSAARHVFELPLQELGRDQSAARCVLAARFWNRMGEHDKVVAEVGDAPWERFGKAKSDQIVFELAVAQMGLGRHEACIATLAKIDSPSRAVRRFEMDAYRAMGDEAKEWEFLWDHRESIGFSPDRLAHLLDLAPKYGKSHEALQFLANDAHEWARDELVVQFAVIRVRLAINQTDLAASDAQCVLLNARRMGDSDAIKEAEGILAKVGAPALDHLLPIGEYLKLPSDCVIHLIHDQTVPPKQALATARYLADFWRCPVLVWPVTFSAKQLSFYHPLAQAIDSRKLHSLLKQARLPRQRAITCVFLTQEKFVVPGSDVFSTFSPRVEVLSIHYFSKYAAWDTRPLPLITAIAVSHCGSVRRALEERLHADSDIANDFAPLQPDIFCNNGHLTMNRFELGVSSRTAKVAARLTWEEIQATLDADPGSYYETEPTDRALVDDLSKQLGSLSPKVVAPGTVAK